ncbi:MAG: NAD(P)H-dependent oxidoreductase [Pseudomonadota bacterium]
MPTLLRIDASARFQGSQSRALADKFVDAWKSKTSGGTIVTRDLAKTPTPHVDADSTAAFTTAPEDRTPALDAAAAHSDALIEEFQSADEVLIATPVYNFGTPSVLKAYVDNLVRAGKTFSYDPTAGFSGLAQPKCAYLAIAYGASGYVGGAMASMDFLKPYLESVLTFIGIPKIETVYVEGTAFDPAAAEKSRAEADANIAKALG